LSTTVTSIQALLHPRSIGILGASANFNKLTGRTLKALLYQKCPGTIVPMNPR
jgi:acetyltransferase